MNSAFGMNVVKKSILSGNKRFGYEMILKELKITPGDLPYANDYNWTNLKDFVKSIGTVYQILNDFDTSERIRIDKFKELAEKHSLKQFDDTGCRGQLSFLAYSDELIYIYVKYDINRFVGIPVINTKDSFARCDVLIQEIKKIQLLEDTLS